MNRVAIYAGSFDPITYGHLWVIKQGLNIFDKLIIAIGVNPSKQYMFTEEERSKMIMNSLITENVENSPGRVEIVCVGKEFIVNVAKQRSASFLLRGVRNAQDFAYENTATEVNREWEPSITTVLVTPPPDLSIVSSSFVKGLIGYDNYEPLLNKYVSESVAKALVSKENNGIS